MYNDHYNGFWLLFKYLWLRSTTDATIAEDTANRNASIEKLPTPTNISDFRYSVIANSITHAKYLHVLISHFLHPLA